MARSRVAAASVHLSAIATVGWLCAATLLVHGASTVSSSSDNSMTTALATEERGQASKDCFAYRGGSVGPTIDPISSALYVQDDFLVDSITVEVNLRHRRIGTLEVALEKLQAATGEDAEVLLKASGRGRLANDMQCTVFDSLAAEMMPDDRETSDKVAPFCGRYQPSQRLEAFTGQSSAGTWMLNVRDVKEFRERRPVYLSSWTLTLCKASLPSSDSGQVLQQASTRSFGLAATNETDIQVAATSGADDASAATHMDEARDTSNADTYPVLSLATSESAPGTGQQLPLSYNTRNGSAGHTVVDLRRPIESETETLSKDDEGHPAQPSHITADTSYDEPAPAQESPVQSLVSEKDPDISEGKGISQDELDLVRSIAAEVARDVEEVFWEAVADRDSKEVPGDQPTDTNVDQLDGREENVGEATTENQLFQQVAAALQNNTGAPINDSAVNKSKSIEPVVSMQSGPHSPIYATLAGWPYASASHPNTYSNAGAESSSPATRSLWGGALLPLGSGIDRPPPLPILPFVSAQYHHLMKYYTKSSHRLGEAVGKFIAADYAKKYHLYAILFTPGTTLHHRLKTALNLLKTPAYKSVRIQFAVLTVTTGYFISAAETLGLHSLLDGLIDPRWIVHWEEWVEDFFDRLGLEPPGKLVRSFLHKVGNYEESLARDLLPGPDMDGPSMDALLDLATTVWTESDSIVEDFEDLLDEPEVRRLANMNLQTMMIRGMLGMLGKTSELAHPR